MAVKAPSVQLLGRQREREVVERVLESARDGHGGVLAVYGEPGVGKTALIECAVEPLRVVDDAEQRLLLRRVRQQVQTGEPDEERIRRPSAPQPERDLEGFALRFGQVLQETEAL